MSMKENILKAVYFDKPDYIPMVFHINASCWDHYPKDALYELIGSHAFLFPESAETSGRVELDDIPPEEPGKPFLDGWGCTWETSVKGIVGAITRHPLSSWDKFEGYRPPDPRFDSGKGPTDWNKVAERIENRRAAGELTLGGLRHGHTFQTLAAIRGYENLILDMRDGEPRLKRLIEMVEDFNLAIVRRYLDLGVEWVSFPEDLGMQHGPMISPALFREYIKPSYERLMQPVRRRGCIVHVHSDGHLHLLADDLIDGRVNVLNLQDLVNGIDWIKERLIGRICIDLDIDRQAVTPFGTTKQIDSLVREEVDTLGCREGGLMMIYGLYPGVPLENVKAVMDAMERYAFYYSD